MVSDKNVNFNVLKEIILFLKSSLGLYFYKKMNGVSEFYSLVTVVVRRKGKKIQEKLPESLTAMTR